MHGIRMRRRHLKLLGLWILPLLLARALIPTGFMLSAGAGGLQLTFCPAGVIQTLASQQQHAGHHDGHHHGDAADDAVPAHNNDNAPCPFSLVASATSGEVHYLQAAVGGPGDEAFEFISAPTFRVGPLRSDRIRGPPVLS
jgi:hypothetical protein